MEAGEVALSDEVPPPLEVPRVRLTSDPPAHLLEVSEDAGGPPLERLWVEMPREAPMQQP